MLSISRRIMVVILAVVASALAAPGTPARAADPIKVGFSMALTGAVAQNGKQLIIALELWRDDVNAHCRGAAMPGRKRVRTGTPNEMTAGISRMPGAPWLTWCSYRTCRASLPGVVSGGLCGIMGAVALVYLVQHGEKERLAGDPGLTQAGRQQAEVTGRWLHQAGLQSLSASPLRRARQTAELIAGVTGLPVQVDARLRERMNWDGGCSLESFLAEWARATRDRDFVPGAGESSRQAGDRLHAYLAQLPAGSAPFAVVTHGGVTVDLIRNLMPDEALPAGLLDAGIPPCAITTIRDLRVESIAATDHLRSSS